MSEEVINETQNRLVKSKNVIVFNIVELPNETVNTSLTVAKEMLSDLALNLDIIQTKRIGKARPSGRPLLLVFNNAIESRLLLKNKSKLRSFERWKNKWVNADLTSTNSNEVFKRNAPTSTYQWRCKLNHIFNVVVLNAIDQTVPKM